MKSIFKAVFTITLFAVFTRALGFLFRIYLSRTIGAEGLGVYQIAHSVFVVLESFIASGIPLTVSKFYSKFELKKDKKAQFGTTTAAFIIGLIIAIILCVIVILFKDVFALIFADPRCILILMCMLPSLLFCSVYAIFRGYFWGQKNFFLVSFSEFFEQVFRILACVILFATTFNVSNRSIGVGIAYTLSTLVSSIFILTCYFVKGGKISKPKSYFKPVLKSATPITGVRVASNLLMPIIAIIMPLRLVAVGFTNEQALSQYGTAMGMTFPLLLLPATLIGSLAMAIVPELSYNMANNNKKDIETRIQSSLKFAVATSAMFLPAFIGLGEPIGQFLFSNIDAGYYLSYAGWIMIPMGINTITNSVLNSLGLETKGFRNALIGSTFLILSVIILPKFIGILSLVWGIGINMTITAFLNARMITKRTGIKLNIIKDIALLSAIALPCALLGSFTYGICSYVFSSFFSLVISGGLCTGMFLLICSIFKLFNVFSYFANIFKYKRKKQNM